MDWLNIMNETFEQFCERMSKVEKKNEFTIGMAHHGCSRAIFEFEGQCCCLESRGYRTVPDMRKPPTPAQMFWVISSEPNDWWSHCHLIYTKERAKKLTKYYGAISYNEDEYPREAGVWFYLVFKEFEDLMKMVWDIYTGKFKELWGDEAKEYESCIGYLEEK